jgi:hypothetical protein
VWLYASHRAYLLHERVDRKTVAETTKRNLLIPVATVIISFVALISVEAGQWLIVTVPLSYVIWTLWAAYHIRRTRRAKLSLQGG